MIDGINSDLLICPNCHANDMGGFKIWESREANIYNVGNIETFILYKSCDKWICCCLCNCSELSYDKDITSKSSDEIITNINVESTITIKYFDEYTKKTISEDEIITNKIGTKVDISKYIKNIDEFEAMEVNSHLTITQENQVVNIYYKHRAKVIIKYIDINGLGLIDMTKKDVNIGEMVYLESDNMIEGYTLIKEPTIKNITIDSNETEISYYYAKNTTISVKYVDIDLNRELINPLTIDGYVGKDYSTEQKEFVGYTFKEVKGNKVGKMNLEENEIIYYYAKFVPEVNIVVHENNSQQKDEVIISVNDKPTTPSKPIAENNNTPKNNTNNNNQANNTNKVIPNNNNNANPNQVISVANTGKTMSPTYIVIGSTLVLLGVVEIIVYRKKKHKVFYV